MPAKCGKCFLEGASIKDCVCGKVRYCGTDCQKADWPAHKASCPILVVKQAQGSDKIGVFTTRKVKAGTRVVEEKPIFVMGSRMRPTVEDVGKVYKEMHKVDQVKVLDLYAATYPGDEAGNEKFLSDGEKVAKLIFFHSMDLGSDGSGKSRAGVFKLITLLNKSCKPNAASGKKHFNDDTVQVTVKKDLEKDSEVLLASMQGFEFSTRAERQARMMSIGLPECKCEVCSLTGEELKQNDDIRRKLQELLTKLQAVGDDGTTGDKKRYKLLSEIFIQLERIGEETWVKLPMLLTLMYQTVKDLQKAKAGAAGVKADFYRDKALIIAKNIGLD